MILRLLGLGSTLLHCRFCKVGKICSNIKVVVLFGIVRVVAKRWKFSHTCAMNLFRSAGPFAELFGRFRSFPCMRKISFLKIMPNLDVSRQYGSKNYFILNKWGTMQKTRFNYLEICPFCKKSHLGFPEQHH